MFFLKHWNFSCLHDLALVLFLQVKAGKAQPIVMSFKIQHPRARSRLSLRAQAGRKSRLSSGGVPASAGVSVLWMAGEV